MSLPAILTQHQRLLDLLRSFLPTTISPEDKLDVRHFQRDRIFTVELLTFVLLYLISDHNHFGYQHTLETLWKELRAHQLVDAFNAAPQKSSLGKARRKLPAKIFKTMFDRVIQLTTQFKPKHLWNSHRLFAIDGMTATSYHVRRIRSKPLAVQKSK